MVKEGIWRGIRGNETLLSPVQDVPLADHCLLGTLANSQMSKARRKLTNIFTEYGNES